MSCKKCNKEMDLLGYFQGFETCKKCTDKNYKHFIKRGF